MPRRSRFLWTLPALLCGCLSPWNTRFPQPHFTSAESQRRESEHQDPFPDSSIGPDTGVRPRGFQQQRTDPYRTKERYNDTILRQQFNSPTGVPALTPSAQYPGVVEHY